jgi:hypothetical protein
MLCQYDSNIVTFVYKEVRSSGVQKHLRLLLGWHSNEVTSFDRSSFRESLNLPPEIFCTSELLYSELLLQYFLSWGSNMVICTGK